MARRFLVFASGKHSAVVADLFGAARQFDVALNDWTTDGVCSAPAEYRSAHPWKFAAVRDLVAKVAEPYEAIALLDDDIAIDTPSLNRLFEIGLALGLDLWQPALDESTPYDNYSYEFLLRRPDSLARSVKLVEIMCPFFSRTGFAEALWTFDESMSGWGLDYLWAEKVFAGRKLGVIDAVPIRHCRPISSGAWVMPNGLKPGEELLRLREKFQLRCDARPKAG